MCYSLLSAPSHRRTVAQFKAHQSPHISLLFSFYLEVSIEDYPLALPQLQYRGVCAIDCCVHHSVISSDCARLHTNVAQGNGGSLKAAIAAQLRANSFLFGNQINEKLLLLPSTGTTYVRDVQACTRTVHSNVLLHSTRTKYLHKLIGVGRGRQEGAVSPSWPMIFFNFDHVFLQKSGFCPLLEIRKI